jgi:uncharacterized GH25 family protein
MSWWAATAITSLPPTSQSWLEIWSGDLAHVVSAASFLRVNRKLLLRAAAVGAVAASAVAHDTWLIADQFKVSPDSTVTLDITSGMEFPKLDVGPKPERVQSVKCRLAGKAFDITNKAAAAGSLQFKGTLPETGVATLGLKLPAHTIELKPDEVEHYFEEVSASEALRKEWAAMKEPRRWRESYTKHPKTFVRVGEPHADRSWAEPVGMDLEIVPEKDPTALKTGDDFPVRVLLKGKPLANFALNAVSAGETKGETRRTDADGRVTFTFNKPGPWLLRGTDIRKATGGDAAWESDFATLTLNVGG